jgi:hypothetical protein
VQFSDADGRLLESLLLEQSRAGRGYPLDTADSRKFATHRVRRLDKDVTVTVPEDRDDDLDQEKAPQAEVRESIQIQTLLAEIGARMGMQIWIPRAERATVVTEWKGDHPPPLQAKNYGGRFFRFWSAVRSSRAAPISHTRVCEGWRRRT